MQVIQVGDEFITQWDQLVATSLDGGLLQSWAWGEYQKSLGNRIFRVGAVDEGGDLVAAALLIKHELPFDYNYIYIPRGPVCQHQDYTLLGPLNEAIDEIARQEKSFTTRMDPAWKSTKQEQASENAEQQLASAEYRKAEFEVQPKCTFTVSLEPDEETLLANMKSKTRYNINLAARKGVTVRSGGELADLEIFWELTKQTSERDDINPHSKEHYKKMHEVIGKSGVIQLYIAEFQGKAVAANLVGFFGTTATYLHGASANLFREAMAPHALQWEVMKIAKGLGYRRYDFGGVNGITYNNPKWEGITRFKLGFSENTEPTEYVGTYEKILNPVVYSAYKFIKQIRE